MAACRPRFAAQGEANLAADIAAFLAELNLGDAAPAGAQPGKTFVDR
jgi:hypothetical protein